LKAVLEEVFSSVDMIGKIFAIEGCGSVGGHFGRLIAEAGGTIVCADLREGAASALADETGGTLVSPEEISKVDCDVYCPCALGGSLNEDTIPHLKARAVAGCANNQLADPDRHGRMLGKRGILYAPDYVINAGGLINIFNEIGREYDEARSLKMMEQINFNLKEIFRIAREEDLPTALAADRFAERRLRSAERAGARA
ncbi:MAG: Glu/Leu/Phe/Val dehydrogenase family protein, partial [Planctomycetota bacterium]